MLANAGTARGSGGRTGPLLALGAGAGFALFFIALDATPADSALWPLLAGRLTTAPLLLVLALTLIPTPAKAGAQLGRPR